MNLANFRFETDADGIAHLVWDMPGRAMNVINAEVIGELNAVVAHVASDPAIKGCVVTSGKDGFSAGADLTMLENTGRDYARAVEADGAEKAMQAFYEASRQLSLTYRRLETCGKPWAAAINGVCLGGGFELTLACHYRVISDNDRARVGLPEIKVGLFPGAGGTQRVARLMATADALQMLFKGDQIKPNAAKAMNQVYGSVGKQTWPPANAIYRRETYDNYPAAKAILTSVFEGLQLPMDLALQVEARQFTKILRSKEAAAMIRSLFVSMGELNKGARRPVGAGPTSIKKVGVLGAGFMGAGVAYVSAGAGIDVVLIDRDQAAADQGKALSHKLMTARIGKGQARTADRDALLARITATPDYEALRGCDLIIEAVFEDRAVKAEATRRAQAVVGPDVVFASNTSTLPITSLAQSAAKAEDFIGIHFFSPVDRMMLVEVIMGEATGERALATALDYIRAIKKTPIVVNDTRGFFANRCVGNYIREGHLMLMEGVPPAMIENCAKMAGMPVGPLSLNDEVALDLGWKILLAAKQDLGEQAVDPAQEKLLHTMVVQKERFGRKNGKGFYDYPEKGKKKLWPGLADLAARKLDPDHINVEELKQRLLVTQALEAARTIEEGVVTDPREADVGSILGFGFAPFTGGALSYIDGMGVPQFVMLCDTLAKAHGSRFSPTTLLIDMAKKHETFYGRFGAQAKAAA